MNKICRMIECMLILVVISYSINIPHFCISLYINWHSYVCMMTMAAVHYIPVCHEWGSMHFS